MAINRLTYYQAPPPDVSYKGTPAYEYGSIFLKNRASQWDLSLKQALLEIKDKAAQNKLLVDAYKRRQSDLQDSLDNVNKLIAQANLGEMKSTDAINKANADLKLKSAAQQQAWAKAAGEKVNVPFSSAISEATYPSRGGFGSSAGQQSAVADQIDLVKSQVGTDPVALAKAVAGGPNTAGLITQTTSGVADSARAMTVETSIQAKYEDYLNKNPSMTAQDAYALAQDDTYKALDANGLGAFSKSHEKLQSQLPSTGGAGGGTSRSTRVSGAVQAPKYNLPGQMPTGEPGTLVTTPVDIESLKAEQERLQAELAGLKPPEAESTDFITRSREIMAGRFGPVMPAPSFYQRNVAQQLQGSTDDQIRQAYDLWKRSKGETPAATEPPAAPAAAAATPSEAPAGSPPVNPATPPAVTVGGAPAVSPAAPGAAEQRGAAQTVLDVEAARNRQKELNSLFPDGVPQSVLDAVQNIGKKPIPPAAPVQLPSEGITVSTGESGGTSTYTPLPPLQTERQVPGIGGRTYIPHSPPMPPLQSGLERDKSAENKTPEPTTSSAMTPSVNEPSIKTYYTNRINEAKALASDQKALQSAVNSGPGKVAADIYRANAATGHPFIETYETITMTFAGDPDNMAKAHATAIALDMAANNKTAPPKE